MARYKAATRTNAVTDAAANAIVAQLWNPSSTRSLVVYEVFVFKTGAGANESLVPVRTSARGATPGATATPGIAQDTTRSIAPPSAAVIETANFGTEPTIDGLGLKRWNAPAVLGSGIVWSFPDGVTVLPGAGLAIAELTTTLAVPVCEVGFDWSEP